MFRVCMALLVATTTSKSVQRICLRQKSLIIRVWNKDDHDSVALIVLLKVSCAHVDSGGNPALKMATGTGTL
jgi:hypothetical protein